MAKKATGPLRHFVYSTEDPATGHYYIGKHSTRNVNDGYLGAGKWVKECKKAGVFLVKII